METNVWLALGAVGTFVLAITAFINIRRETSARKKNVELRLLNEISNWARDSLTLFFWSIKNLKKDETEVRSQLTLQLTNSMSLLDTATDVNKDLEIKVNEAICAIGEISNNPSLLREKGKAQDVSRKLTDVMLEVASCKSRLLFSRDTKLRGGSKMPEDDLKEIKKELKGGRYLTTAAFFATVFLVGFVLLLQMSENIAALVVSILFMVYGFVSVIVYFIKSKRL